MSIAMLLSALLAAAPVQDVVDAERSFAAMAEEEGVTAAFRTFIADDGVMFVPDPHPGKEFLQKVGDRPGSLVWWPVYAGVAASGDLGFTTGPFTQGAGADVGHGHYFTIWRKQPDGTWRWLLDHGPRTKAASPLGPDSEVETLSPGTASQGDGWEQVVAAEAALAAGLAGEGPRAYLDYFDADSRLMRTGPQPAIGLAAIGAALEREPEAVRASQKGGAVSDAGDLAYTYGDARWSDGAGERRGHYVRIWQHRARGWTLVVDNLVLVPERPHHAG